MEEVKKEIKPIGKTRKMIGQIALVLIGVGILVWMLILVAVKFIRR